MNIEFARMLFDILVENALRIQRAGFGVNWVESVFFDILDLLRTHPALKGYFLEQVQTTLSLPDPGRLDAGMLPRELVELASHELRWEELRQIANDRIQSIFGGDSTAAVSDVAQAILDAFETNWSGREFYKHYS